MPTSLSLESFENAIADDGAPNADYNQGYEEGLAAGFNTAKAESETLTAALVQAVSDIDFTYAEARGQVLAALSPLFATIAERILPHCVSTGFATELADMLAEAAAADTAARTVLHVHPAQLAAVEAAITTLPSAVTVVADPALDEHAAWIENGHSETLLDVDALLKRITEVLGAIHPTDKRMNAHG